MSCGNVDTPLHQEHEHTHLILPVGVPDEVRLESVLAPCGIVLISVSNDGFQ